MYYFKIILKSSRFTLSYVKLEKVQEDKSTEILFVYLHFLVLAVRLKKDLKNSTGLRIQLKKRDDLALMSY